MTYLYKEFLRYDKYDSKWGNRDRFILSKGHASTPLYILLNKDSDLTYASSSVDHIELSTGSLGHGLGVGCGMALAAKLDKKDYRVIVLLGDGELNEGSVWESIQFASHHKLDNLIAIIDCNKQCVTDFTIDCNNMENINNKFLTFNWSVSRIDGHSFNDLDKTFKELKFNVDKKPNVIICDTIKGKGVSFMEKNLRWHHSIPSKEEYEKSKKELSS